MPVRGLKKAGKALARGFKTRKRLKLAKKAGKIQKELKRSRGAETSGVRSEALKRLSTKRKARRIIKKISKLNNGGR